MAPDTDLLTVAEVADLLDVSRMTVHRWTQSGVLTPKRIEGTRWVRYSRREVEALVASEPKGAA